jgi:hypothetical protein
VLVLVPADCLRSSQSSIDQVHRYNLGFYDDLSVVLNSIAIYSASVHAVDDFNVCLDRTGDTHAERLRSLLGGFVLPIGYVLLGQHLCMAAR